MKFFKQVIFVLSLLLLIVALSASVFFIYKNRKETFVQNKDNNSTETKSISTNENAIKYVALGDSLAVGTGANKGYVDIFKEELETNLNKEVFLTNLGQEGWTSSILQSSIQNDPNFKKEISEARVITINIGGNDFLLARYLYKNQKCGGFDNRECLGTALNLFKQNWKDIVEKVRVQNSNANVLTMNLYYPFINEDKSTSTNGRSSDYEIFNEYLNQINFFLKDQSLKYNLKMADIYQVFNGNGSTPADKAYISGDGFHPNSQGYSSIAKEFIQLF